MIGYEAALKLTLEHIDPLGCEAIPLARATDRVAARELCALVDSPSVDTSLKDGYAVCADDVANATWESPRQLELRGTVAPGMDDDLLVEPGTAIRVLTGARVPKGADAVVSEEFAIHEGGSILVTRHGEPGRNILSAGSDVCTGAQVVCAGAKLAPGQVGMLAAAGHDEVLVFRRPSISVIATGDEIVAPGHPLPQGKLFASNLMMLNAWCMRYGMKTSMGIVRDDPDDIIKSLSHAIDTHDAVVTSGGAWTGDRDFVVTMLDRLGWRKFFHRIKMGPGKAVGFGLARGKPVFVLPGGPTSNLMAFLQIALPGLMKLAGHSTPGLHRVVTRLSHTLTGRQADWTQFYFGLLEGKEDRTFFNPTELTSRLQAMAKADGIVAVPEGVLQIPAGAYAPVQLLM